MADRLDPRRVEPRTHLLRRRAGAALGARRLREARPAGEAEELDAGVADGRREVDHLAQSARQRGILRLVVHRASSARCTPSARDDRAGSRRLRLAGDVRLASREPTAPSRMPLPSVNAAAAPAATPSSRAARASLRSVIRHRVSLHWTSCPPWLRIRVVLSARIWERGVDVQTRDAGSTTSVGRRAGVAREA